MKTLISKSLKAMFVAAFLLTGFTMYAQQVKPEKQEKSIEVEKKQMDGRHHGGQGGNDLGLNEDQKAKMEKLKTTKLKNILPLRNQIAEKKAHLNTLMTTEKVDMNEINKTIDEMGTLKIQIAKIDAMFKQEVRKILTDEQRLKFDMKMISRKGPHQGGKKGPKGMKQEIRKEVIINED